MSLLLQKQHSTTPMVVVLSLCFCDRAPELVDDMSMSFGRLLSSYAITCAEVDCWVYKFTLFHLLLSLIYTNTIAFTSKNRFGTQDDLEVRSMILSRKNKIQTSKTYAGSVSAVAGNRKNVMTTT
jgi:hypothetical protein